jgi:hypothetical protein
LFDVERKIVEDGENESAEPEVNSDIQMRTKVAKRETATFAPYIIREVRVLGLIVELGLGLVPRDPRLQKIYSAC